MYAIVRAGGRQEKVAVGDVIELNRLSAQPGDSVTLPVLLLVNEGSVTAGEAAAASTVSAEVLEHTKGEKIRILRYKNKTGYRRRQGHRQALTKLRVTGIEAGK